MDVGREEPVLQTKGGSDVGCSAVSCACNSSLSSSGGSAASSASCSGTLSSLCARISRLEVQAGGDDSDEEESKEDKEWREGVYSSVQSKRKTGDELRKQQSSVVS